MATTNLGLHFLNAPKRALIFESQQMLTLTVLKYKINSEPIRQCSFKSDTSANKKLKVIFNIWYIRREYRFI
jgi:hypothetical protein